MICCALLGPPAIDETISTITLFIVKQYDPFSFNFIAAFGLNLYDKKLTAVILAAILKDGAILEFLGCVLILFSKPCDVYTMAVIVSVLIRFLIVTVHIIFKLLSVEYICTLMQ